MWKMYLENYQTEMLILVIFGLLAMAIVLFFAIVEFRKSNKDFENMLREKQRMNNQLRKN